MKVKCNEIKIGNRVRKDLGDLDSLVEDIKKIGLLQPIGITKDNELVFGGRRLAACKLLKYEEIEVVVVDSDDIFACEVSENVNRTNFIMSERVAIRKLFKEKEVEEKGKIMAKGIKLKKKRADSAHFRDAKLAKLSGVGRDTARKENIIVAHGDQELIDNVDKNILSVDKAYNLVKKLKKKNEVYLNNKNQENEVYLNNNEKIISKNSTSGIPQFFNIERSIKLTKELDDEIKRQADELGMSISALIRSVLKQYFK